MLKWISNLFLGALAVGLSLFTGSRTLDLLGWILPVDQQIVQWLGLAAFELGMYFWCFYFVAGAKGIPQRSIAVIMACFSIIAVSVCTIADVSLGAAKDGKIRPFTEDQSQALIIFVGIVIVANVAAFLACKLLSIDNLRLMREQNAEDHIHEAGLHAITQIAPHIAAQAAPYLASEWASRTWQKLVPGAGQMYFLPNQQQPAALPQPEATTQSFAPAQRSEPETAQYVKPNAVGNFIDKINPFNKKKSPEVYANRPDLARGLEDQANEFIREERERKRKQSIDTSPLRSSSRPSLEERKRQRRERFVSKNLADPVTEDLRGDNSANFPQSHVRIQRNQGPYVVNKNRSKIPLND